jgi:hypothetical protein
MKYCNHDYKKEDYAKFHERFILVKEVSQLQ